MMADCVTPVLSLVTITDDSYQRGLMETKVRHPQRQERMRKRAGSILGLRCMVATYRIGY